MFLDITQKRERVCLLFSHVILYSITDTRLKFSCAYILGSLQTKQIDTLDQTANDR